MSDHDEPELHESPLDPADDARIRALLADARHTDPMPADVVARLDRVLSGLADERAPIAPVIDLARRRRTAAKLLVAAAAVVVAGVGIGQVLPGLDGGGSANEAGAPAADSQAEAQAEGGAAGGGDASRAPTQDYDPQAPEATAGNVAHIRKAHFGADVRLVRSELGGEDAKGFAAAPEATCLPAPVGEGTVLAVDYDGAAAALVLRPPAGDTQVVDLYLCGQTSPQRSITLTAR